jgi:hypothetical protein
VMKSIFVCWNDIDCDRRVIRYRRIQVNLGRIWISNEIRLLLYVTALGYSLGKLDWAALTLPWWDPSLTLVFLEG